MSVEFKLNKWKITPYVKPNGILKINLYHEDKSEICEVDEDLSSDKENVSRFTTNKIEADYNKSGKLAVEHHCKSEQHFDGDWLLKISSDTDGHLTLAVLHKLGGELFKDSFIRDLDSVIEFERL